MSWCELNMTFDLGVVTLTFKILSRIFFRKCEVQNLILGRIIDWECRCTILWCYLEMTFRSCHGLGYFKF